MTPLVIYLPGPVPYKSKKAIPYKYGATMFENGKEVPLPSIVNIADISRVTRSGHIFNKRAEEVAVEKKPQIEAPVEQIGQPGGTNQVKDNDEILKLIQKVNTTLWISCYILFLRYLCYLFC